MPKVKVVKTVTTIAPSKRKVYCPVPECGKEIRKDRIKDHFDHEVITVLGTAADPHSDEFRSCVSMRKRPHTKFFYEGGYKTRIDFQMTSLRCPTQMLHLQSLHS